MKQLTIGFGVELDWVPNYAAQLEADIHGNNIMVGSTLFEGTRFAYQIDPNISFLVCDAIYKEDIHFKFKNTRSDFIEIHYNLSEDPGLYYLNNRANVVGRETYNLAILDSAINGEYVVKKKEVLLLCYPSLLKKKRMCRIFQRWTGMKIFFPRSLILNLIRLFEMTE